MLNVKPCKEAGIFLIEVFPDQLEQPQIFLRPIYQALSVRTDKLKNWRYLVREGQINYTSDLSNELKNSKKKLENTSA